MKPLPPLVLLLAATSATCYGDCRHVFHRQAIVAHHAYVQPVVLYSVGDALRIEAAVEKALAKREAGTLQQKAPQSVISAKCSRCHTGAEAKGSVDFSTAIDASTFRRSMELLGTGKDAPPAMAGVLQSLTPEDKGKLMEELLRLSEPGVLNLRTGETGNWGDRPKPAPLPPIQSAEPGILR